MCSSDLAAKAGFELPAGSGKTILVFRPTVSVGAQSSGGMFEPNGDWTEQARSQLAEIIAQSSSDSRYQDFEDLITQILEIDPRPAFQKRRMPAGSAEAEGKRFGIAVLDHDVKWEIREGRFLVTAIVPLDQSTPTKGG